MYQASFLNLPTRCSCCCAHTAATKNVARVMWLRQTCSVGPCHLQHVETKALPMKLFRPPPFPARAVPMAASIKEHNARSLCWWQGCFFQNLGQNSAEHCGTLWHDHAYYRAPGRLNKMNNDMTPASYIPLYIMSFIVLVLQYWSMNQERTRTRKSINGTETTRNIQKQQPPN